MGRCGLKYPSNDVSMFEGDLFEIKDKKKKIFSQIDIFPSLKIKKNKFGCREAKSSL